MNKLITFLLLILFIPLSTKAEVKMKNSASIFNVLIDCPSLEDMEKICKEYKFTYQGETDGFQSYLAPDDTNIQFRMDSLTHCLKVPFIQITTTEGKKQIEKMLNTLGYEKEGTHYISGHKFGRTQKMVTLQSNKSTKTKTLTITKILNQH